MTRKIVLTDGFIGISRIDDKVKPVGFVHWRSWDGSVPCPDKTKVEISKDSEKLEELYLSRLEWLCVWGHTQSSDARRKIDWINLQIFDITRKYNISVSLAYVVLNEWKNCAQYMPLSEE